MPLLALSRHCRRHVHCAGVGVPVLQNDRLGERRSFPVPDTPIPAQKGMPSAMPRYLVEEVLRPVARPAIQHIVPELPDELGRFILRLVDL